MATNRPMRKEHLLQLYFQIYSMFKRLAEEIKVKYKVCKIFRQQLKGLREFQILMNALEKNDMPVEEETKQGRMTFDHTLFKNRQNRFPKKAELITLKKPEWRTEGEMKYLCSLLQNLRSYQLYSSYLQMLLAKVFRFERFGRRRVIVKKGHIGSSFYFIYYGSVGICSDDDGSSAFLDQKPHLLHKGAKFGDIALIKGQKRNATVVCMCETEFLVVDKKDFFANKLDEQLHKEFRARFDYFRSLDIFSHWPAEHIISISENCQAREFNSDQLIIPDTCANDSIAFISEAYLDPLPSLTELQIFWQGTCEVMRLVELPKCPSYHRWLRASLPFHNTSLSHTTQKHPKAVTGKCHQKLEKSCVKSSSQQPHCSGTAKLHAQKLAALKEAAAVCCTGKKRSEHLYSSLKNSEENSTLKAWHNMDAAILVQIDILHERDFLGLHEALLQDDQKEKRSFMLISKGCKIILLKMEKFNEFSDPKRMEKLKKYQKSYQSDDILCKFFLQHNDWKMFKRDLVSLIVKPPNSHQAEKKNFQPSPSQTGILDLCSTFPEKQKTRATSAPNDINVSKQNRRQNPSERNVHLVHEIVVPRPRLDRMLY
ncbi:cyclic nucleotide-binding domain-containing protein 2-like [Mantella aurantiaca]